MNMPQRFTAGQELINNATLVEQAVFRAKFEAYEPDHFEVIKPEDVTFFRRKKNHFIAINDEYELQLDRRSNTVGQLLLGIDPEDLKQPFMDGRFFIVDDQVVDHRLAGQGGFEHSMKSIEALVRNVGLVSNTKTGKIIARSITSDFEYNPFDSLGGLFNVDLGFRWSPFSVDINSLIEMVRQICENGLAVSSPVVDCKIPIIGGWEDNLKLSNDVLSHVFHKKVDPRMKALPEERISLADAVLLTDILESLTSERRSNKDDALDHNSLVQIRDTLVDNIVTPDVKAMQKNILKFIPAPMTGFDAMNICTEIQTHYVRRDSAPSSRLQGLATNILFDDKRQANLNVNLDTLVMDAKTFADTDRAFFGETCH